MEPGGPAQTTKGTVEFTSVLDDHYLRQEMKGDMMGQPYNGRGFIGYNNSLKKYQSLWIDSMSTGFYLGEGTADKDGKSITFVSTGTDPVKNKVMKGKDIWRQEDDKRVVFEMWSPPMKGSKLYKSMEIVYTRK
jgi:hypothetical protein